jgi:glyoxylase-like metal-dependent hydrolase (beta-lactamase superfamily II)
MIPTTNFSIRSLLGGYDKNFTYVVTCSRTGAQLIVDAAVEFSRLSPFLHNKPLVVLLTHTHGDHIAYLEQYVKALPEIIVLGHPKTTQNPGGENFKTLAHNQAFKIGEMHLIALHTPGHYYDSICYQLDSVIYTGDTLFVGRTGRVISAKSDIADLYDSVYNKLLTLPGNTRIYPGHDYGESPTITLTENIKISPLLQAKNLKDFKQKMDEYERNRTPGS